MPLTTETGTGLANADSYVTMVEFKAFCAARGYDISEYETADMEAKVRDAFDWVNTNSRYKGSRLTAGQSGEFPRSGCTDWSGYEATGVPLRVKNANSEAAFKSLKTGQSLFEDLSRGGQIMSESVGPLSVTYAQGAPAGTVWTAALNFLKPYIREHSDSANIRPGYASPVAVQFDIGMNDNPADTEE